MTNKLLFDRITTARPPGVVSGRCVVYWMSRDKRASDNWALIRAIEAANQHRVPVLVAVVLSSDLPRSHRQRRQLSFMLEGLNQTAAELHEQGIGFVLRAGDPAEQLETLCEAVEPILVVADQDYTRGARRWRRRASERLKAPLEIVEATTIVPTTVAADKQVYGAYIMRPKLHKLLSRYLVEFPSISAEVAWQESLKGLQSLPLKQQLEPLNPDDAASVVDRKAGSKVAREQLRSFIDHKLKVYPERRNDPTQDGQSGLSAYLHFGQISAQRVALEVRRAAEERGLEVQAQDFLDELITWRELAINYCKFNNNYDNFRGLPDWSQRSLQQHASDPREHLYSYQQLETAQTHDELWNAAQNEMLATGRIHGYLRMYWGKKILEWTESPQQAIAWAVRLNDTYMLDGRDPAGYAGILWAIGGLHDRSWFERDIFGKVRYMSRGGAERKFDVEGYIKRVESLGRPKTQ